MSKTLSPPPLSQCTLSDAALDRSSTYFYLFCLSNRILLREAEPSLHMVSGLGHIESEWERQCWLTLLPSIAVGQWERDRREARAVLESQRRDRQSIEEDEDPSETNGGSCESLRFGVWRNDSWLVTVDRKLCGSCSVFMPQNKLLQCGAPLTSHWTKRRSASWDVKPTCDWPEWSQIILFCFNNQFILLDNNREERDGEWRDQCFQLKLSWNEKCLFRSHPQSHGAHI